MLYIPTPPYSFELLCNKFSVLVFHLLFDVFQLGVGSCGRPGDRVHCLGLGIAAEIRSWNLSLLVAAFTVERGLDCLPSLYCEKRVDGQVDGVDQVGGAIGEVPSHFSCPLFLGWTGWNRRS